MNSPDSTTDIRTAPDPSIPPAIVRGTRVRHIQTGEVGTRTAEDVATERAMTAQSTIDTAMGLSHDDRSIPRMLAAAQVEATLSLAAEVRALREVLEGSIDVNARVG